jgi:hypothetical protein
MNCEAILKRFKLGRPQEQDGETASSALEPSNWRQMDRLVRSAVRNTAAEESKLLFQTLHQLQVQNELLRHKNEGLREAATLKQKHKQPSNALDLHRKESYHGGATFWSPRKMREVRAREVEKQQQEEAEIAVKANRKELQAAAKLLKEQEKEERRVAREEQKVVREREREGWQVGCTCCLNRSPKHQETIYKYPNRQAQSLTRSP